MMKRTFRISISILLGFILLTSSVEAKSIKKTLKKLDGVESVDKKVCTSGYSEKYEIMIEMPVDHTNPEAGVFQQRVFLLHQDFSKPMVVVTEGYAAFYAERPSYNDEIARSFGTNLMVIEHRYFSKSTPEKKDWEYLTIENAAADHHKIIQLFKTLYKDKWLSTGISKGGTTCIIHRSLYPEDVDITVPYVAPINFGLEDGRHEPYINNISTKADREKIMDFQIEVLKRRDSLMPLFKNYIEKKNYTFRIPVNEVYDYCVLEYSFAFWQWGVSPSHIPELDATDREIFMHFVRISGPDYFAIEGMQGTQSFFIQASYQLGYYGYETEPFKDYLIIETAEDYLAKIFIPEDYNKDFSVDAMNKVQVFLDSSDVKMIFIYGEFDPWSATGVEFPEGKENMYKFVNPGGSHATRINSLPKAHSDKVKKLLNEWLYGN